VRLDDLAAEGKAEPHAARLGGLKRLEKMIGDLRGDADPV
jgi:hypothetical protein